MEATDPSMAAGMAFGATAFNGARSLVLPVLMRSPGPLLSKVPFFTRVVASSAAMVPEVGAFWATSHAVRGLTHPLERPWDSPNQVQGIVGLAMTLGFLKTFGFVFGGMGGLASGTQNAFLPKQPLFWQQAGMLSGVMAGHGAEIALGWRRPVDFHRFFVDSLVTLGQFNFGGILSQQVFPALYRTNHRVQEIMGVRERAHWEQLRSQWEMAGVLGIAQPAFSEAGRARLPEIRHSRGGGVRPATQLFPLKEAEEGSSKKGEGTDGLEGIRRATEQDFPEIQNLIEVARLGDEGAREKIRRWDFSGVLKNQAELEAREAKLLLVLAEEGHKGAAQTLVDLSLGHDSAVDAIKILAREGRPLGRQTLAAVSIGGTSLAARDGNLHAASVLESLALLGRGDALEALGAAADNNAGALVGLFELDRSGFYPHRVRSILQGVQVEALLMEVEKGDPFSIELLSRLVGLGHPQAAQGLIDQAALHHRVYRRFNDDLESLSPLAKGVLRVVNVTGVTEAAGRNNPMAMQVLEHLILLGHDPALRALVTLAKNSNHSAMFGLRLLGEADEQLYSHFEEALQSYTMRVWPHYVGEGSPGELMVFLQAVAPTGSLPDVYRHFAKEYTIVDLNYEGEILLQDDAGQYVMVSNPTVINKQHPFGSGDRVVVIHPIGGGSPESKDGKTPGPLLPIVSDPAEVDFARRRLEQHGLDIRLNSPEKTREGKLMPVVGRNRNHLISGLERYRVVSVRIGENKSRHLVLQQMGRKGPASKRLWQAVLEDQPGRAYFTLLADDLVDLLRMGQRTVRPPRPAVVPNKNSEKIKNLRPEGGLDQDLASLAGNRPSLAGDHQVPGLSRERILELESLFEEGHVIIDMPRRGPVIAPLESGATTIGVLQKASPAEQEFFKFWKKQRGFGPVDFKEAERHWNKIQSRSGRLKIPIRFGKNFYRDPMTQPRRQTEVFKNFGGPIVVLSKLLEILPDSFLKHSKLEAIRLNTDRVGPGLLSSYENSKVYLYEGTFLGSRRNLIGFALHELGHAAGARYDLPEKSGESSDQTPAGTRDPGDPDIHPAIREKMHWAHRVIADNGALIGLDYGGGAHYREGLQANHFSEFMAEFPLLYVGAGPRLRAHIASFPQGSEVREAWDFVYGEWKDRIFDGWSYDYREAPGIPPGRGGLHQVAGGGVGAGKGAGEAREAVPVHYRARDGRTIEGSLLKSGLLTPRQLGEGTFFGTRRYRVEAVGADGSLLIANRSGKCFLVRGEKESELPTHFQVGEEVVFISGMEGGSGERPTKKMAPSTSPHGSFLAKQLGLPENDLNLRKIIHHFEKTELQDPTGILKTNYLNFLGRYSPGAGTARGDHGATDGRLPLERLRDATNIFRHVLTQDALRTSSGSYYEFLLQVALERALRENNTPALNRLVEVAVSGAGLGGLHPLFQELGWNRAYQIPRISLNQNWGDGDWRSRLKALPLPWETKEILGGYLQNLGGLALWVGFGRPEFKVLEKLFPGSGGGPTGVNIGGFIELMKEAVLRGQNHTAFAKDIREALERGMSDPLPFLYFDRFFKILATNPLSPRLRELGRGQKMDWELLMNLYRKGRVPAEIVANLIDGTVYTGYLQDPVLAKKMAQFYYQAPQLTNPETAMERLGAFYRKAGRLLGNQPSFTKEDLLNLLAFNPSPRARFARQSLRDGELEVGVVSAEEMARLYRSYRPRPGSGEGIPQAFFVPEAESGTGKPRIVLKEIDPRQPTPVKIAQALGLTARLLHEFEHYLHHREYQGRWTPAKKLLSELRSAWEEQSYLIWQGDLSRWHAAELLTPEGFGVHLRKMVESDYLDGPQALVPSGQKVAGAGPSR